MITLTKTAALHFQQLLKDRMDVVGIRLGVKNAGCSGFAYVLDFATVVTADDKIFEPAGSSIKIVVDSNSLKVLSGLEIDCVEEALGKTLKFNNPNVKAACGCGESFSVS